MSPLRMPKGNLENTRSRPEFRCFPLENQPQNTKLQGRRFTRKFRGGIRKGRQGRYHYERHDDVVTRSSKRVNTVHNKCIHIVNMSFLLVKARREGCSLLETVENMFFVQGSSLFGHGV